MNILNLIKHIYRKTVILDGERLTIFPLKPGMRQGYPFISFLFNTVMEVTARFIRGKKLINKTHPNGKGRSKSISIYI